MKTIITSVKGPPLRRVLCSLLFGAAAFCVVPANIQAQAPPDIIFVTTGNSIARYNLADGSANTNFIYNAYIGPILVSGPTLYVGTRSLILVRTLRGYTTVFIYPISTYNAAAPGNVTGLNVGDVGPTTPPVGMALWSTNLYVVSDWSISILGSTSATPNPSFTDTIPRPAAPYALAVNGPANMLYVTCNSQNSNGDFYISTYNASTGDLIQMPNSIEIATTGLYGLALKGNTLYVSVFSGSAPGVAPGVYTYDATSGAALSNGPLVSVQKPWGIAIGSPRFPGGNPTLYVASHQDSKIYEFDAINGGQPFGSIQLSGPPTNITVEPATQQ